MILLTGASGFLGSHLLPALSHKWGKEEVLALTSKPIEGVQYLLTEGYELPPDIFTRAGYTGITKVVHAGAYTPKSGAAANDWLRCSANIANTQSLLQALPEVKTFINLSTLDVYGTDTIISESSPVAPPTLYGLSKYYCERMAEEWAKTSGTTIQNLRVGHTYGPGEERYKKIIPETFRKILSGDALQIWGTGEDIRSFIYVDDVVRPITAALELTEYRGPVNLVGAHRISVKDIVAKALEISGKQNTVEYLPASAPGRNLLFDNTKMKQLFGAETVSLEEGLTREWNYMKTAYG